MLLGSECRSLELHFFPGRRAAGPARCVRENDMTVMTSWHLFDDLRSAQDEMLRMSRMPGQWLGQFGQQPAGGPGAQAGAPRALLFQRQGAYLVGGGRHG